jgi:hypothetical protein
MVRKRLKEGQDGDAEGARAARRAEREAAKRREMEERNAHLSSQLEDVRRSKRALAQHQRDARERCRTRDDLADHLDGFYEEVDKLAKGRTMIEVTPLVLEEANRIIRDAKSIVVGDAYLDRVKEFVPAGTNPVYPDVVIALRSVRQALERARGRIESREQWIGARLQEAATLEAVLDLMIESPQVPSLQAVQQRVDNPNALNTSWFSRSPYGLGAEYQSFDVDRLKSIGAIEAYFAIADNGE